MRANLLDELHKPYVTTARAKGLSEWRLVLRYPARLALNPLISTIGWYLPALFSGSLIVATVMNLPNIGPLLLRALINQDMYLAGAILLIYSFLTVPRHAALGCAAGPGSIRGSEGLERWPDRTPPRPRSGSSVASNWTLMWWRFRRHRLAVVSAVVLIALYARRAVSGLLQHPGSGGPPTRGWPSFPCSACEVFDGWSLRPWVPGDRRQAQSRHAPHRVDAWTRTGGFPCASSSPAIPIACSAWCR